MNIKEELLKLYNTMLTIETKGVHTKTMADCLKFIEQLYEQVDAPETTKKTKKDVNVEK